MIKVGDLVQLKSGSCNMTVTRVDGDKSIQCAYWGKNSDSIFCGEYGESMHQYVFSPECLVVVVMPTNPELAEKQQKTE